MIRRALVVAVSLFIFSAIALEQQPTAEPLTQPLGKDAEKWVEKTLKGMSTEEKVGQLIQVRGYFEFQNAQDPTYQQLKEELQKYHIGSVIMTVRSSETFLSKNQPYEAAMATNQLQKDSKLPLLIAADFERGLSMRLFATPNFPHAMAFAATPDAIANAERFGSIVARESRAIGVHWNYFPVADINTNPANPIINVRAFGEDPKQVSDLVAAYIRGSHAGGMLATAKHFPGHGDTDRDTHIDAARVNGSLERLQQVELAPFRDAIKNGLDSVMVAHVTVPAIEPDPNKPSVVSHKIVHDLLQDQLGFQGLIVTDAMEMRGLTSAYGPGAEGVAKANLDAILAGNDMVLLPTDVDAAFHGLVNAVKDGTLPQAELDKRVRKILRAKAAVGLHKSRFVDVNKVRDLVGRPDDIAFAQQVADAAVTLVKDDSKALQLVAATKKPMGTSQQSSPYDPTGPMPPPELFALIAVDDMRSDWGRMFERELRARVPNARIQYVDARTAGLMMEPITQAALDAKAVIVAGFAVPVSGKRVRTAEGVGGATSMQADISEVIGRVMKVAPERTAFVSLGNPYLGAQYAPKTYICTYSNAASAETAAVKALFGELPMRGKLPVSIPGMAQRGTGVEFGH
jgi:beta-N-acetylhexosaminidase